MREDNEIWKLIPGYNEYKISTHGRVKSLARKKGWCKAHERILKLWSNKKGYLIADLTVDGRKKHRQVHRLVAEAYIPNPGNKPQVNHKNGVKTDNRVDNLEWVTNYENHIHKVYKLGVNSVSPTKKVECIDTGEIYSSVHLAAIAIGAPSSYSEIAAAARGERKKSHGYKWRYL